MSHTAFILWLARHAYHRQDPPAGLIGMSRACLPYKDRAIHPKNRAAKGLLHSTATLSPSFTSTARSETHFVASASFPTRLLVDAPAPAACFDPIATPPKRHYLTRHFLPCTIPAIA
ncbi:Nn.00g031780.m01.CDS01 [Neocucurbitaria sp. VM-36]